MTRVKRGNVARNRRKKILKANKGYRGSLSKLFRPAHQAYLHAGINAYRDRRLKKREFRRLWIARLYAALELNELSYSKFMGLCKQKNVELNRKVLSELALNEPETFNEIISFIKG